MNTKVIGIKELHRRLSQISKEALKGNSFTVVKNYKPVFRIEPIEKEGKYSLTDFNKIQFESKSKNLSKEIDKVMYGK